MKTTSADYVFENSAANPVVEAQRNMVRQTLDEDRLVMYFQPIMDLKNRAIGVEALARVRTKSGEILPPAAFLGAIEGSNLIVNLDRQAFELSCRAATLLKRTMPRQPMFVACNLSATTLAQPDLAHHVLTAIRSHDLLPRQLCIEVTETAAFSAGTEELDTLDKSGVLIALDNFGLGYCELSSLQTLPLSYVKIDRSCTAALDRWGPEGAIATTTVEMAKALGIGVVAEGVETTSQRRSARKLGLQAMQGWFYTKALAFDDLICYLQKLE